VWVGIAAFLFVANLLFVIFGVSNPKITGYGGTKEVLIGVGVLALSVVLYTFRRVVQDKQPLRFREEPTAPPAADLLTEYAPATEERQHGVHAP
jgi:hypothetical protein